jgi:hypothetical protein
MSAEIVNLRQVRKRLARVQKERDAEENRRRFGRSKADQQREEAEKERADRMLDGTRRDTEPGSDRTSET